MATAVKKAAQAVATAIAPPASGASAAEIAAKAANEAVNAMRLQQSVAAQAQQSRKMPVWVIPAIIGVVGLGALFFILKRKKA